MKTNVTNGTAVSDRVWRFDGPKGLVIGFSGGGLELGIFTDEARQKIVRIEASDNARNVSYEVGFLDGSTCTWEGTVTLWQRLIDTSARTELTAKVTFTVGHSSKVMLENLMNRVASYFDWVRISTVGEACWKTYWPMAILAMRMAVFEKPDQLVKLWSPMKYVVLSEDARVVDGKPAVLAVTDFALEEITFPTDEAEGWETDCLVYLNRSLLSRILIHQLQWKLELTENLVLLRARNADVGAAIRGMELVFGDGGIEEGVYE